MSSSFPTVGQTAFVATTASAGIGVFSILAATKAESTTQTVAFGALGLVSCGLTLGFSSAYLRSEPTTTPKEYLQNGVSDAGHVIAATATLITQAAVKEVSEKAIKSAGKVVEEKTYDYLSGNSKKKPEESKT
ncbi:MAG: hypothetical protein V4489_04520 [Chlamydiota bacterium]